MASRAEAQRGRVFFFFLRYSSAARHSTVLRWTRAEAWGQGALRAIVLLTHVS